MPEALVESLCLLLGQLAVGAVDFEEEAVTPPRYAEMVSTTAAMGRPPRDGRPHATPAGGGAIHARMSLEQSTKVYQWGTFVHREHRGHRLGLATKAVNLRAVQAVRGDLTLVTPQNAETNDNMVSSNEQMGFRPIEIAAEFVKRL